MQHSDVTDTPLLIIHPPLPMRNDSSNGSDSHLSYHWQPAVDFVQVDEDGDVPRAQVQGMDVGPVLALAVLHPQRGPAEAGGGGGGQHGTGHGLLEVREHVVLTKVVFLWRQMDGTGASYSGLEMLTVLKFHTTVIVTKIIIIRKLLSRYF